ncbi:MAG: hypothetical protein HON53_06105 [Planctomycetaceae bacterium]|jgi:hypothetical protein|nr:hypothetical protein [Planctomycetaceae bacterium]MBT6154296.1 hypothetical protein [Planctomycetaceae bacterium]MBT6485596.1 hypothetical protein [Planctomycetaceae bacterium]MBT6493139.1 hypothetical protein [Planctomycetaceae bacterium]
MTRRIQLLTVGIAGLIGLGITYSAYNSHAAEKKEQQDKVAKFMRAKLDASQVVLEGLVTEDYDKVKQGADKMAVMSKATEWQVIQGPVYAQYSSEFRRSCEQMAKMAKDKNLDGAALSYMHLTMTCISCHKHVHSSKIAAGEEISPALQLALRQDAPRKAAVGSK